jgi:hypothetical protein
MGKWWSMVLPRIMDMTLCIIQCLVFRPRHVSFASDENSSACDSVLLPLSVTISYQTLEL